MTALPITVSVVATATKASYLDWTGRVAALLNPLLDLKANASVQKQTLNKNEKSKIYVHVDSNTYDIVGANIAFRLTGLGTISSNSGITNSTGDVEIEYTAPATIPNKQSPVVFIRATKPGYTTAQASVFFNLMPDPKLDVMIVPEKNALNSSESTKVEVRVTYQSGPIQDASVEVFVSDGKITPVSGKTNATGIFSAIFTAPIVGSQITAIIDANASKAGYINGTNSASISIFPIPGLAVSVTSNTSQVYSGEQATLTVAVTENSQPIANASILLNSTQGSIVPSSGKSDASGKLAATFTAPTVSSQILVTITANASKAGYGPGSGTVYITVNPKGGGAKIIYVSGSANPASLKGGETSTIIVTATSDAKPLTGGNVALSASDGSIDPNSGATDSSGKFTANFTAPDVTSATDVTITADITKSSYTSGKGTVKVHVEPWTGQKKDMTVSISAGKTELKSLEVTSITVTVREGLVAVPGAKVTLTINSGTIQPISGNTNSQGTFKSTFTAPNVTADTAASIIASATKAGYNPTESRINVTVKPEGSGGGDNGTGGLSVGTIALIGLSIGAAAFFLLLLFFMKMRKKCQRCGKVIPKGAKTCPNCQPWNQQQNIFAR
jgi:hypothetical protein